MAATNGPKKARRYRSTLRAQTAAETRRNILDTGMRLFLDRGFGRVTVNDIAAEAALAVATVYASVGGKAAILNTLIEDAMGDPVVEETLSAVRASRLGHDVLHHAARGTRIDNERYHDIVQVMKNAAAVDTAAADILQRSDAGYRQALGQIARRLRTLKSLKPGINEGRATDVLWFYLGHQAWHLLVRDSGWTWDDAEQWLRNRAAEALLADTSPNT
jgi:AcrR family transcriptional regulator